MVQKASLATLVRTYRDMHEATLDEYLGYFRKLTSLDDAIHFACCGKGGITHPHQYRVGKRKLTEAWQKLKRDVDRIRACESFEELVTRVGICTESIDRFGTLAVYDTALRLGAYLGHWPKLVYLHAGTKAGYKALVTQASGDAVGMEMLPKPLRVLEPYHAENFLCIFESEIAGSGKDCRPQRSESTGRGRCR